MVNIKISNLLLGSLLMAIIFLIFSNAVERKLSEEEIDELSAQSDAIVSSLNSESTASFNNGDLKYTVQVLLDEENSSSTVKVQIEQKRVDKVDITYPAKLVDGNLMIGTDYKIVKTHTNSISDNVKFFICSFCIILTVSIIISILFRPKKEK